MNPFKEYLERKKSVKEYGDEFDSSDLDRRFAGYYGTKTRLKIKVYSHIKDYSHIMYGTVGVSSGWKPVFILLASSRAQGSSAVLNSNCEILGVKRPGEKIFYKP